MTGLEVTLIIAGIVIVVVSFLFGEQFDGRNSDEFVGNSINSEEIRETVKNQVDEAVDDAIDDTVEKTAVELDKLSNEKIMAVSEYSENVLKEIEKNHEEVMFLYGMLNDKEEQIKNTVKDVEMVKASVKKMAGDIDNLAERTALVKKSENTKADKKDKDSDTTDKMPDRDDKSIVTQGSDSAQKGVPKENAEVQHSAKKQENADSTDDVVKSTDKKDNDTRPALEGMHTTGRRNNNQMILELYNAGKDNIDIARELNLGLGEVRLVIDLYKTRGKK